MSILKTHFQKLFEKSNDYYGSDRAEIIPFIPKTVRSSLEFGGGQGDFSALVKNTFNAETWVVELNKQMSEIAATKNDRVVCMDAYEALEQLPDQRFDSIFFLDILEHLIDPYSLLHQCRDKLSKDGVVIASIPNIRYYRAFKNFVFKGTWEYKESGIMDITHLRFFTYSSIQNMFKALGYDDVSIHGIHESSSNGYRILNWLSFNRFWDVRFKHFIVVAKKS